MRQLALLTLALVATVATQAQDYPRGWINLFEPPFAQCPTIMLGIACVSKDSCFIPGGANGVGFDVFNFNGQQNGNFSGLYMPKMPMMLMSIGAGGTTAMPHGATAGFGIGDGVQYIANASTMLPATGPDVFFVISQDTRASKDGKKILIVDQFDNSVLVSSNHGKTFDKFMIPTEIPLPNQTEVRYGAFGSDSVWYVSMGSWPSNSNGALRAHVKKTHKMPQGNIVHQMSQRISLESSQDGKFVKRHVKKMLSKQQVGSGSSGSGSNNGAYSAVIAKTLDAGKTWHNVMYEATDFYLNGIDCASPTHCIAVGEGFDQNAAAHVFLSTDGLIFRRVLHLISNDTVQFSLMSVSFNGPNEAWVAGGAETSDGGSSIFYYTKDGGKTWTQHAVLPYVMDIADMSFADGVGYAVALTQFDDSTVLRYDSTGPNPTPAPTWLGNFTQVQCTDSNCQVNCTSISIPQNACLGLNGGGSAIAQCQPGVLMMEVFPLSATCTGPSAQQAQPLNQCMQGNPGSFETFCGPAPTGSNSRRRRAPARRPSVAIDSGDTDPRLAW